MQRNLAIVVALAASGCAQHYAYRPAENATASVAGVQAASYSIPADAPRGDVRIASFGIVQVARNAPRALHVRMVIANESDRAWSMDARQQVAVIGGTRMAPSWIAAEQRGPIITIAANGRSTVNLFYQLPPGWERASRLPEFDLLWSVKAGDDVVTARTPFDRLRGEELAFIRR